MPDALHLLMVSPERALLRRGAQILEDFGVRVTACANPARAREVLAGEGVDFLLLDEATLAGDAREMGAWKMASGANHVQLLLLCGEKSNVDIEEAHQYGADDFLRKPFGAGELLARLRAGARFGEFERRCQQQNWEDPVTGLWARQALVDQVNDQLQAATATDRHALLVLEIDFFDRLERALGATIGNRALCDVASLLEQVALPGQIAARLHGGRFALFLPKVTLDQAAVVAEQLRAAVTALAPPDATAQSLSISIGVVACGKSIANTDDALAQAGRALHDAQRSGRDCVARFGQFDDEQRQWAEQLSSGNPFATCAARDVMTPVAVQLQLTDSPAHAETLFQQTQLDALPVLDAQGRLAGLLERDCLEEAARTSAAQTVESLVTRTVIKLVETTMLETVIEQFVADEQPLLVIVSKEGRPRGFIQREQFLNLVKPLEVPSAATTYATGTQYLVVGDLA
jgi:diguanylate cyclase (GGDEF)-like protein